MNVRSIVLGQVARVATEQQKAHVPLTDSLPLLDSGLDSLCLAVIVARLEDELGVDPFSTLDDAGFPVTIGDVIALYERAAAEMEPGGAGAVPAHNGRE